MTTVGVDSQEVIAARGKRAAVVWGSVIVGLLVLQLVLGAIGVTMALRGKSAAVESDYYEKALHWDDQKAAGAASAKLGWTVKLSVGEIALEGGRAVTVMVMDKEGVLVKDAQVRVGYFHHALPKETREAELAAGAGGIYRGVLPVGRPGLWELRLKVTEGEKEYSERIVREVGKAEYREGS
jgi:nitrogen fixation protein FixH